MGSLPGREMCTLFPSCLVSKNRLIFVNQNQQKVEWIWGCEWSHVCRWQCMWLGGIVKQKKQRCQFWIDYMQSLPGITATYDHTWGLFSKKIIMLYDKRLEIWNQVFPKVLREVACHDSHLASGEPQPHLSSLYSHSFNLCFFQDTDYSFNLNLLPTFYHYYNDTNHWILAHF